MTMVTAFVAGLILSGAPQEKPFEYKPKHHSVFAYGTRLSSLLRADNFVVNDDGAGCVWSGNGSEIMVDERTGIVRIITSDSGWKDLNDIMKLLDVPVEKCRVTLTLKRNGIVDQTVTAEVNQKSEVRIGGGFGMTEVVVVPRRNGDGTFTMAFGISRDFGPDSQRRESRVVLRVKSGQTLTFAADKDGSMSVKDDGSNPMPAINGGLSEPGVSLEATVAAL